MTSQADLADLRRRYAAEVMRWARREGFDDPRVEAAFASVPRESCLPPPPWRVFGAGGFLRGKTSDPAELYADVLVTLDAGRGINNGQPSLHAAWMAAIAPRPGDYVVQIGAGTGYYTAILAELVGPGGRVEAYEIEPGLAAVAARNLAPWPQARIRAVSGTAGLPQTDVVYVAAGAAAPPLAWLTALRPGGRLIFPWQPSPDRGWTLLAHRVEAGFSAKLLFSVAFVGCVGADPRTMRMRGMPARAVGETRSIRLRAEREPDETATAIYEDLWFSSAPV